MCQLSPAAPAAPLPHQQMAYPVPPQYQQQDAPTHAGQYGGAPLHSSWPYEGAPYRRDDELSGDEAALLAVLPYLNTLQGGFVYDD